MTIRTIRKTIAFRRRFYLEGVDPAKAPAARSLDRYLAASILISLDQWEAEQREHAVQNALGLAPVTDRYPFPFFNHVAVGKHKAVLLSRSQFLCSWPNEQAGPDKVSAKGFARSESRDDPRPDLLPVAASQLPGSGRKNWMHTDMSRP